MSLDAIHKYDGRVVAFDLERLASSVARATLAGGEYVSAEEARALGHELACACADFLVKAGRLSPQTAELREMALKLLRETGHVHAAEAYAEHARASAGLIWRLRVTGSSPQEDGQPWDRRRLIESLRASGVAKDPAGEMARNVERRLLAMSVYRISAALIHALVAMEIAARGLDTRCYTARRIAVAYGGLVPRFDEAQAALTPLPSCGPALEAFWLQAVHSSGVAAACVGNTLGLEPFPSGRSDEPSVVALDPLAPDASVRLHEWMQAPACAPDAPAFLVRGDDAVRIQELSRLLANLALPADSTRPCTAMDLELSTLRAVSVPRRTAPFITLNAGGLLLREALRDQHKATVRLAQLVALAAQAHREREEYWGFSAARGRVLPLAAAGLWNAAAWLIGEPYDCAEVGAGVRVMACALASSLASAVNTLRNETGMDLVLSACAPAEAAVALWRRDRVFLAHDGVELATGGVYAPLDLRVGPGTEDLGERIEFLRATVNFFDAPPALRADVPFGQEADPAAWREFLGALLQSGAPRARLTYGGSARSMRLTARQIRSHLEGFPLFAQG